MRHETECTGLQFLIGISDAQGAFTRKDIDVNPRYGRWDATTGTVVAPDGPQAPTPDTSEP